VKPSLIERAKWLAVLVFFSAAEHVRFARRKWRERRAGK